MSNLKQSIIIILVAVVLGGILQFALSPNRGDDNKYYFNDDQLKDYFYSPSITTKEIQNKYESGELKILIVAGHTEENFGTRYGQITEHEINKKIANKIAEKLKEDEKIEVVTLFDEEGMNVEILRYLERPDSIEAFRDSYQKLVTFFEGGDFENLEIERDFLGKDTPFDVVRLLYGVNKWSNENDVDIVLNIHLNNYPGRNENLKGVYEGFSIYVPGDKLSNSKPSQDLSYDIFRELKTILATSTAPSEADGVIKNEELIALGSFNTLESASVLIEYGFIYEDKFVNPWLQQKTIEDITDKTISGLYNFLN